MGVPRTVDGPAPDLTGAEDRSIHMGMIKKVVKGVIAAKVIQVAARELQKPENQAKIRDGLDKLSKTVRTR